MSAAALSFSSAQTANQPSRNPAAWQRYTLKNGEFSVLLPTLPAMTTISEAYNNFNEERVERTIAAYADGAVYAIWVFEYRGKKQSLSEIMTEFPRNPEHFKRELNLHGVRGKEYGYENDEVAELTQFYESQKKIYVFEAFGSTLGNIKRDLPKFLDSIDFSDKSDGEVMVDGPGLQTEGPPPQAAEIFSGRVVTSKARAVSKPQPSYTALARKNQVTGTIVIRCVFSSYGTIRNVHVMSELPDGLTQQATSAAARIRFVPAIKDGHFVSMWMELQYNFNLY